MLRGVHPLIPPDLLHALASMGHGDRLAIVDANFPAAAKARRLIAMPGLPADVVLAAVLHHMPIDDFVPDPALVMQVVGNPDEVPEIVGKFAEVLARYGARPPTGLERHEFYRAAAESYVVVQTGERRFYGNILVLKGVLRPPETRQHTVMPPDDPGG